MLFCSNVASGFNFLQILRCLPLGLFSLLTSAVQSHQTFRNDSPNFIIALLSNAPTRAPKSLQWTGDISLLITFARRLHDPSPRLAADSGILTLRLATNNFACKILLHLFLVHQCGERAVFLLPTNVPNILLSSVLFVLRTGSIQLAFSRVTD